MASAAESGASLYAVAPKIYPRRTRGPFATLRWVMVAITQGVYYGTPWLRWHGRQAVLFDITARRFHLFGLTFWPQDFILLTGLLVCCALALFLFTALAGRLWCGYACPQTVYTSLFLWLERRWEGDSPARRRLDAAPWTFGKSVRKVGKHLSWGALALWTGFTFVGYFTPVRQLLPTLLAGSAGSWEVFWVLFYGAATYGNAGWMREQVCLYLCPYARFQGVMMDADTLTVTYDAGRGEPRGGRGRQVDAGKAGLGACLDCSLCVQVCPTGIDIRQELQIGCLNCGLCADACNVVMDRHGYARGLIRYVSERCLTGGAIRAGEAIRAGRAGRSRRPSPRVLADALLLALASTSLVTAVVERPGVRLDVMRDRAVLSRDTPEGQVENVYRLQVLNLQETAHAFVVEAAGIPGIHLGRGSQAVQVPGLASVEVAIDVDVDPAVLRGRRTPITLAVRASDDRQVQAVSRTQFLTR